MKYIIVKRPTGMEFAAFCLAPQTHAELATAFRRDDKTTVVAAGFVEFLPATGTARVFGRSSSLNLGPRPQDAMIINTLYLGTLDMAKGDEARRGAA